MGAAAEICNSIHLSGTSFLPVVAGFTDDSSRQEF
jgi:hypothetical protein